MWGTGAAVREWLFVDDGAEAMVRGMDCASCVEPINVGVAKRVIYRGACRTHPSHCRL